MRIVSYRHGDSPSFKTIPPQQSQADTARTVMAFDNGDLDDISLWIVDEITAVIALDKRFALFCDDAAR